MAAAKDPSSAAATSSAAEEPLLPARELLHEARCRIRSLEEENEHLRSQMSRLASTMEEEEERIANKLIKRTEELIEQRNKLNIQIEQEEEYLTNTLQRKLNKLRQDKIDMENELEAEEERMTNKLQIQLAAANAEKENLLQKLRNSELGSLMEENVALQQKILELEKRQGNYNELKKKYNEIKVENFALRKSNEIDLERQVNLEMRQAHVDLSCKPIPSSPISPTMQKSIPSSSISLTMQKSVQTSPTKSPVVHHGQPLSPTRHNRVSGIGLSSVPALQSPRQRSYSLPPRPTGVPGSAGPPGPTFLRHFPPAAKELKSGWLLRLFKDSVDQYAGEFERRYFVLYSNGELHSWENEVKDSRSEVLDLDTVNSLSQGPPLARSEYTFELAIVKHEGSRLLGCESRAELDEWSTLLGEFIQK